MVRARPKPGPLEGEPMKKSGKLTLPERISAWVETQFNAKYWDSVTQDCPKQWRRRQRPPVLNKG